MTPPSVSVVLEWDNAFMSGTERARSVLNAVGTQVGAFDGSIELVVVFDDLEVDGAALQAIVGEYVVPGTPRRFVGRAGSRYYEQKNAGAAAAAGDVVVFVDSDTIPEPEWLREIVRPFGDPEVQVVAGSTYTNFRTVPDKAFAVTWNFPLRADDGPIRPTLHFNANCVAFRRTTWAQHPFPEDARFRGQCHTLALELAASGIEVASNPLARVAHPPPKGLRYVTERALCQGHDRLLGRRLRGVHGSTVEGLRVLGSDVKRSTRAMVRDRRRVELSVGQVPVALAICYWYHLWSWMGWTITRIRPAYLRSRLRV